MQTCALTGKPFEITPEDLVFYQKMGVPPPTLCPEERQRRRIAFRNFRSLYHRECDGTGKKIISMYSSDKLFPVFESDYWWSDQWNAFDYGQNFDFSKSFFDNYQLLSNRVPRTVIINNNSANSNYCNLAWLSKNCYLVFGCVRSQDCLYGHIVWDCKNCVDGLYLFRCEWCSHSTDLVDCYDVHFSTECSNCSESSFLHDCRGCQHCFASTNLRNKQYYFLNKKCTKEEYAENIKKYFSPTYTNIQNGEKWFEKEKREKCVFPESFSLKSENCMGNHIYESKNVMKSFDAKKCEDSKFLFTAYEEKNCYDISFTAGNCDFCLDSLTLFDGTNEVMFSHFLNGTSNSAYSEFCFSSSHLLGCIGLRNAHYCILNKQYSKEEYFAVKDKIIEYMKKTGEWGEFFPISLSPFGYNETVAQEYFPLTKEETIKRGWKWKDEESPAQYSGEKVVIPDAITDVSEDIVNHILTCEGCSKNYRLVKPELGFYRKMNLPVPRKCPNCRHAERMKLRNPRKLFDRQCQECKKPIETTYAPERPEKVLCEKCYEQALV